VVFAGEARVHHQALRMRSLLQRPLLDWVHHFVCSDPKEGSGGTEEAVEARSSIEVGAGNVDSLDAKHECEASGHVSNLFRTEQPSYDFFLTYVGGPMLCAQSAEEMAARK
jgi:hypothetical protein